MPNEHDELEQLRKASQGNQSMLGGLLARHQDRLCRMVRLRMDRRLRGRIDAADVIQETFLEVTKRLDEYLRSPAMPFFVWLRFLAAQKLVELHRHHLGVQARDANREISIHHGAIPQATSAELAERLIGRLTSASRVAARAELKIQLQAVLNNMDPMDREILALRHFEQLSLRESAQVLGIKHAAACNRYVRAARRLKSLLADSASDFEGMLK